MAEIESRLLHCFEIAFPELAPQEIPAVSMASLASWDSLAGITLFALIEEEFGVSISPDDAAGLVSFELILDYLKQNSSQKDCVGKLPAEAAE